MKKIIKSALFLLCGLSLFTACDDDRESNPCIVQPQGFVLNKPAYSSSVIDLSKSTNVKLTWSQPNYGGFPVAAGYVPQVSLDGNFTVSAADEAADATTWTVEAREADGTFAMKNLSTQKIAQYSPNYSNYACYKTVSGLLPSLYEEVLMGDVNRDGTLSIADVTALVNIILGKTPAGDAASQYDLDAADVNFDGAVSIADVTSLVNTILGKN